MQQTPAKAKRYQLNLDCQSDWNRVNPRRPIHIWHELMDELMNLSTNQTNTVPYGGIHACFSIHPPIRPGTRNMVLWVNSHQVHLVIRGESNSSLVWMGHNTCFQTWTEFWCGGWWWGGQTKFGLEGPTPFFTPTAPFFLFLHRKGGGVTARYGWVVFPPGQTHHEHWQTLLIGA